MDNRYFLRNRWDRRTFLKGLSAAGLTSLVSGLPRRVHAVGSGDNPVATADSVILLWMAGGMAHTETFDPKPRVPYRKGIRYGALTSTFDSIPTSLDGVRFSEGLENLAAIADKMTIVRSFSPPDLGHILHSRHQYHWHTGYTPPQTVEGPHIGAMIARTLGPINDVMPPFVHIGQRLDIDGSPEVRAFLTAGFLGQEYAPILIPFPERASEIMSPAEGMTPSRFENRERFFKRLVAETPKGEFGSDYQKESFLRAFERGHRLLQSDAAKAFDLSLEPEVSRKKYETSRFGRGCLLARRLVEKGARFVEVSTEHIPFGNWDTHVDGHKRTKELKQWVDAPVAQLILDLEDRGMLERTLVVLASEFSRTAVRDPSGIHPDNPRFIVRQESQYGLHQHFTSAGSVLMVGGGMKQGMVYGKTADKVPCQTIEDPVGLEDLHATMYTAMGIAPDTSYEIEQRPYYVTKDGKGKAVKALMKA